MRFISNHSSGKMGYAIAEAAAALGAETVLVPVRCPSPPLWACAWSPSETAPEMMQASRGRTAAISPFFGGAVADWRNPRQARRKDEEGQASGTPLSCFFADGKPRLLRSYRNAIDRPATAGRWGFAAETENVITNATQGGSSRKRSYRLGSLPTM